MAGKSLFQPVLCPVAIRPFLFPATRFRIAWLKNAGSRACSCVAESPSKIVATHRLDCDVLVAGGGPAGLCCAIAAARHGARVILCQDRPVLGGNASSEIRMHIVGANGVGGSERGAPLETEAREGGIIEEIRLEAAVRNPQRSASMFDLILYEKCRAETNLTSMLNTSVCAVELGESGEIAAVIADRASTEDRFHIRASVYVDCTGDGRLGAEAGAAFMEGREAKDAFGESLAPERGDTHRLGSTLLLQARRHGRPMPFVAPDWARKFSTEDLRLRLYASPGDEEPSHEYGWWWAEWGGTRDTIKDNEDIRDELLAVALGIWDHIKNGPPGTAAGADPHGASNWALDWLGFVPGKRESRRFIGRHILTQEDILHSRPFDDAIAYGGWSLDLHPPEGVDAPGVQPCVQHEVPWLYDIPLSCCVARDVPNLMFAGRNLSATHVAFSSTRVMATCAAVGQGVGTAAAVAVASGKKPGDLCGDGEKIAEIRSLLVADDAYLIDGDFSFGNAATTARISASSESPGGEAKNVISRQTRAVHGERGAPPDRRVESSHRWRSDPEAGLPAWLMLRWEQAQQIEEVRLIFDTGLHRHLTLSQHDGYTSEKMIWGQAQPETVRDYQIEVRGDGEKWSAVALVEGNYQRLRRHGVSCPDPVHELRITVSATHGLAEARICGLRICVRK